MLAAEGGRADEDFAAVCHDLRQFVIAGMLLVDGHERDPLPDDLRHRFALLRTNFESAGTLLDRVLGLAAPGSRAVDVAAVADEVVQLARAGRPVTLHVENGPVLTRADPLEVRRLIGGLVRCAAESPPDRDAPAPIQVRVSCEDGAHPVVEVAAGDRTRVRLTLPPAGEP